MTSQGMPLAMRKRLERNRVGMLAGAQWLAVVTQPLTALLVLLAPLAIIFGPRLMALSLRGIAFAGLLVLVLLLAPAFVRARRYARSPLRFAELRASSNPFSALFFWRPVVMYDAEGEALRFQVRLTSLPRLRPGEHCLVYYLQDGERRILLSLVSADHPEARHFRPLDSFWQRAERRT